MGARYEPDDPLSEDIRVFPVSRCKKYLIFYRPIAGGIEVLRVLHGVRDIHGLLAEDLDLPEDEDDQSDETPDPSRARYVLPAEPAAHAFALPWAATAAAARATSSGSPR